MSKKVIKTSDGPKLQDTKTGKLAGSVPSKPVVAGAAPSVESLGGVSVQKGSTPSAVELAGQIFNNFKHRDISVAEDFSVAEVSRWSPEDDAKVSASREALKYELSVASIVGMGMGEFAGSGLSFVGDYLGLPTPDSNSEEIRREIRAEFGAEAAGYGRKQKMIPMAIAQRINHKYPTISPDGGFTRDVNPKALKISRRYMSLFGDLLK